MDDAMYTILQQTTVKARRVIKPTTNTARELRKMKMQWVPSICAKINIVRLKLTKSDFLGELSIAFGYTFGDDLAVESNLVNI